MFIIDLNYKAPMDIIDKYLEEHNRYLDENYAQLKFISSGRKVLESGGIILANFENRAELMNIIKDDPFYKNNLADYKITEFEPNGNNF